jgi:hypothetical protein
VALVAQTTDADPDHRPTCMANNPVSRALRGFKLADALMVVATCVVAVPATILAQPARPAPVQRNLSEAEYAAAKCYALRAMVEVQTDPAAVAAWAQKYSVDAQACRELLARRAAP